MKELKSKAIRLPKLPPGPLKALYAITFCYFFTQGVLAVVLPVYTRQLGFSYSEIGGIVGSLWLGTAAVKLLTGWHSDIVGRRPYLTGTLALAALGKILFPFAVSPSHFAALMALEGITRGLFSTVRAPLVTELSTAEQRGTAFGLISAASAIGMSIGNFGAGSLFQRAGLLPIFFSLAVFLAIAAAGSLRAMPAGVITRSAPSPILRLLRIPGRVRTLVAVNFLQSAVLFPLSSLVVPFYLTESLKYGVTVLGYLFAVENLVGSPIQAAGGYLADRTNAAKLFAVLIVAGLVPLGAVFLTGGLAPFLALYALSSISIQMSFPVLEAVESTTVRSESLGFDFSVISMSVSLGGLAGNLAIGRVIDLFGPRYGFPVVALGFLAMILVFMSGFLVLRNTPAIGALEETRR